MTDVAGRVLPFLEEGQRRGFLGPGPLGPHVDHALHLVPVLPASGLVIDLGSGGGLPGLPLAIARPDLRWFLVDANKRRTDWLAEVVAELDGIDIEVRRERAEEMGRGPVRGQADAVVARSFAAPAITAECAAPLLRLGGILWVAEPPTASDDRWPADGVAILGLDAAGEAVPKWRGLALVRPCPDRYPRRTGIPAKRPLF